jgi:hypothetical protein
MIALISDHSSLFEVKLHVMFINHPKVGKFTQKTFCPSSSTPIPFQNSIPTLKFATIPNNQQLSTCSINFFLKPFRTYILMPSQAKENKYRGMRSKMNV